MKDNDPRGTSPATGPTNPTPPPGGTATNVVDLEALNIEFIPASEEAGSIILFFEDGKIEQFNNPSNINFGDDSIYFYYEDSENNIRTGLFYTHSLKGFTVPGKLWDI